jgi:hypothetical protein
MTKENVAAEERNTDEPSNAAPPTPRLDRGEERGKAVRGELIMDELLAVTVRPENVPTIHHGFGGIGQGFAPFGLFPVPGARPTNIDVYAA